MVQKKYLIVASKLDRAGTNITTELSKMNGKFEFYLCDKDILYNENLNLDRLNRYDFIIFASKHQSQKGDKSFSIHCPGNWQKADFGGEQNQVSMGSALFSKHLYETLCKNYQESDMKEFKVTLEATHHGPSIDKPCLFIEIGSSINEWENVHAANLIARTIKDAVETFEENPYREVIVAIGGPHYCPGFNKIQEYSNLAIAHTIASYNLPLTEEMITEALKKTSEEVDFVVLDWKGMGNSEERQKSLDVLNKLYIRYKKTSEIDKSPPEQDFDEDEDENFEEELLK